MYCSKCGSQQSDSGKFCNECGSPLIQSVMQEKQPEVQNPAVVKVVSKDAVAENINKIFCSECGNSSLQYITEENVATQITGSNYSAGKGCLGFLLFGPFGLFCGNCGNNQQTKMRSEHKHFWICPKCGNRMRDLKDIEEEIELDKTNLKALNSLCKVELICCVGLFLIGASINIIGAVMPLIVLILVLTGIMYWIGATVKEGIIQKEQYYEATKRKMYRDC